MFLFLNLKNLFTGVKLLKTYEVYQRRINILLKGIDFLLTLLKINLNKKKIKMNDILVKEFNREPVYNFIWRNKLCCIALDVANVIGYKDKSI